MLLSKKSFIFIYLFYFNLLFSSYNDIVVNGSTITSGAYSCKQRYEAFKPILDKFKRNFSVLDVGAAQGCFSFKVAYDFPNSINVMIEGGFIYIPGYDIIYPNLLLNLCEKNTDLNNIIFLRKKITSQELKKLSECEHFDVIFAFNIFHHFKNNWKKVVDEVLNLGEHVIIELPTYAPKELQAYVAAKAPVILGKFPRGKHKGIMRYYQNNNKKEIKSKAYGYESNENFIYEIKSNFFDKKIIKKDESGKIISERNWSPGINLCTFKALNGVWPNVQNIRKELLNSAKELKIGFFPYDIIISGNKLKFMLSTDSSKLELNKSLKGVLDFVNLDSKDYSSYIKNLKINK